MEILEGVKTKPSLQLKSPLIVALDVDDVERVRSLVDDLADFAGCFKVGPRLVYRYGESLVREISEKAPVFVDCKFFDIPSTMEASVRAAFEAGATFVTIHALAGPQALQRMAQVEQELNFRRPFKILSVTILTSWKDGELPSQLVQKPIVEHVKSLVADVQAAGMKGIVCSPMELESLPVENLYCVTPGVRLPMADKGDQSRVLTPDEAIEAGAKAFVVGRPIVEAKSPREAAMDYAVSMMKDLRG